MKTGADISHHQATFDPTPYFAGGQAFIFLKATEGGGFTDPAFRARWQQVGTRPRGAYHFGRPGGATVDAQADHFIAVVRAAGWTAQDAWVLDLEDAGGVGPQSLVAWADRWCNRVRNALTGRGLFYTYPAFWHATMGSPPVVPGGALLWWAEYDTAPDRAPSTPACWQYTSQASVAGVSGPCDHNRMTDDAFQVLFGGQEEPDMFEQQDRDKLEAVHKGLITTGTTTIDQTVDLAFARLRTVEANVAPTNAALAQLGAQVAELTQLVKGLVLGDLGDLDVRGEFTGVARVTTPVPPAPVADVQTGGQT